MHTRQQLLFAQHFPFTNSAKKIVGQENLSLEDLPGPVIERAEMMAQHALEGKKYQFEIMQNELLLQEILAFPVAKIIVSLSKDRSLYRRFSEMVADSAQAFLESEQDKKKAMSALAADLGTEFDYSEKKGFFATMPLQEFLSVNPSNNALKLVNQLVTNGTVHLTQNDFSRFLREKALSTVLSTLPVPTKNMPKKLQATANRLKTTSIQKQKELFTDAFKGRVSPNSFPACISSMYGQLAAGQKIAHMANFTLAAFLNSIGMPKHQMLALFKKAPNFNERIASYQIERITKQNYAPPSCEKIRSYGLCPDKQCRARHPLSYYRRQLAGQKQEAPK